MPKRAAKPVKQATPKKCKTSTSTDTNCNNIPTSTGTNWNNMPMEMKAMIMKNMDFATRTNLKVCSKWDKCLVEAFPIVISKLTASIPTRGGRKLSLIDKESDTTSVLEVLLFEKQVTVTIHGKKRVHRLKRESDARTMIDRIFYYILLASNIQIKRFETQWRLSNVYIRSNHVFNFKSVKIAGKSEMDCLKWLKHIPKSGKIDCDFASETRLRRIVIMPWVLEARHASFEHSVIDNDHLLKFKATHLSIIDSHVDINGVRSLIKKWIDENYPIGSQFTLDIDQQLLPLSTDEILVGIVYETMENDDDKVKIRMGNKKLIYMDIDSRQPRWIFKGRVAAKE